MTSPGHRHKVKHPGYDPPGGFYRDYSFIFSEELPYLRRRNKVRDEKIRNEKRKRK